MTPVFLGWKNNWHVSTTKNIPNWDFIKAPYLSSPWGRIGGLVVFNGFCYVSKAWKKIDVLLPWDSSGESPTDSRWWSGKKNIFPNVNHYSQCLRFAFFLSKCLISLPSPSPWCLRWWWIFQKISCCVTYFHRVWSPGGDWWINIHFTSNNNLSSLSPDGTTSLGPSVNFVKVLVPMSYSYLAMAVGSVDFGEARGSIPNMTGWKTDQRTSSYENFAKGRVSFQRGILPKKILYFQWSPPWHFTTATLHYMSAWSGQVRVDIQLISWNAFCDSQLRRLTGSNLLTCFWHIVWHSFWQIFWHSCWHIFQHSFWHIFWQSFWHIFWHIYWHSFWHIFWHSFWHVFLTYRLTFFLTNLLTFFLTYLLKFFLTDLLASLLTVFLTYLLTFFLTYLLAFFQIFWHIFWHSVWHIFWHSFWHIFWHSFRSSDISSDILSDISSAILSDISFDIRSDISFDFLSDISSEISSDILSDISFDILPGRSSDIFSDISFDILSDISSDILSDISFWHPFWQFFLTYLLTFFLTYLLTFFLTYLLTFFLTDLLTFFLTSDIPFDILSDISPSAILSDIFSAILSDMSPHMMAAEVRRGTLNTQHRGWGPARNTEHTASRLRSGTEHWTHSIAVDVRRGTLNTQHRGWGPAWNTELTQSWLRSGTEHWTHTIAVEVRRGTLTRRRRRKRRRTELT